MNIVETIKEQIKDVEESITIFENRVLTARTEYEEAKFQGLVEGLECGLEDLEELLTKAEEDTCKNCMFYEDERKCPMASPEAMSEDNTCYNFYKKDS